MRSALILLTAFIPIGYGQVENPVTIYKDVEKQVMSAKTLRINFAMSLEVDNHRDEMHGNIWLGEGNKARIEVTGTVSGGKEMQMKMISDGTKMVTKVTGAADKPARETPKSCGEIIRGTIARAGVFAGLFYGVNEKDDPKIDDLFQNSDFSMGQGQKLAKRELVAVVHKIAFRGAKDQGLINLVVDSKTHIPIRRVFTINDATHKVRVIESYSEFSIDTNFNGATLFDLPD